MRRIIFISALALLLPLFAGEAATHNPSRNINCKTAKVQIELNYCADHDFKSVDGKLNAVYRKLLNNSDSRERELLKAAERNWIGYRDSECTLETAGSAGGSMAPMEYSTCLTEKTKVHINELEELGD
jgi:uncharacterized protein YecT (DUF1311 family)